MRELIKLEIPQFELLDSRRFVDFLRARVIHISNEELEHFEEIGFLYPLLRLRRPKIEENGVIRYAGISSSAWFLKKYFEADLLEFPNLKNFRPWDKYRDKNGVQNTLIFYHPYQLLLINRFLNLTRIVLTSSYLETTTSCKEMFNQARKMHGRVKQAFLKARPLLIRKIGLLLQLQNAYQPYFRKMIHLTWDKNSHEKWVYWRKNRFSPSTVLEKSGLSLKEVEDLRDYYAVQAHFVDPMSRWYPLVKLIAFGKKQRLKGKALLAQDYYEIVGILNYFLRELTDKRQPEPDDIVDGTHGKWKDDYYGKKFDYEDQDIRRKIISDYLDVAIPKLVLLVEGDTEETSIRILMKALGTTPEIEGITIINYEGTGGITFRNSGPVLQTARSQNVSRYLVIDNDEDAAELVRELTERHKLLDDNCYRIWQKDFERDNFGLTNITETVNHALAEAGLVPIDTNKVIDRLENHPEERLWDAMHNISWMSNNKADLRVIISKKKLARALSIKRAMEIRQEIKENKYKPKWEIEKELIKILGICE